jgi:hypothetical protein
MPVSVTVSLVGEIALLVALDQRVRQTKVVDIGKPSSSRDVIMFARRAKD